jgi:hypothetical protein
MPRPSSFTLTLPSTWMVTTISVAALASASSTLLSTTS